MLFLDDELEHLGDRLKEAENILLPRCYTSRGPISCGIAGLFNRDGELPAITTVPRPVTDAAVLSFQQKLNAVPHGRGGRGVGKFDAHCRFPDCRLPHYRGREEAHRADCEQWNPPHAPERIAVASEHSPDIAGGSRRGRLMIVAGCYADNIAVFRVASRSDTKFGDHRHDH